MFVQLLNRLPMPCKSTDQRILPYKNNKSLYHTNSQTQKLLFVDRFSQKCQGLWSSFFPPFLLWAITGGLLFGHFGSGKFPIAHEQHCDVFTITC
jgi:hypothetical protein